ncbi:MAG: cupin domain-containing protein [Desulfurobacteriaceae bacterium]
MVEHTGITDEEVVKKTLKEEGYTNLFTWTDPPNTRYSWHTHPSDEVRWILEGEITIGTEEKTVTLKPGDKLRVPAGTRHWAEVGKEGVKYVCGSKE